MTEKISNSDKALNLEDKTHKELEGKFTVLDDDILDMILEFLVANLPSQERPHLT